MSVASPIFVLWKWTQPGFRTMYSSSHVNNMVDQLQFNGIDPKNVICITDDPEGIVKCKTFPLWKNLGELKNISGAHLPSCYRRLRLLDSSVAQEAGIELGRRIVSFDLDAVICRPINKSKKDAAWSWGEPNFPALFKDREEDFVGWYVPGNRHRIVLNGSMWMFTNGACDHLWKNFDPVKSPLRAIAAGYMGSDQGYLSHALLSMDRMKNIGGWTAQQHGVLSYVRDVRQTRILPKSTRVVFFAGKLKPWDQVTRRESTWISRYADMAEPPAGAVPTSVREEMAVAAAQ